jgi:nicotinamidase-related amidase
MAKAILVMDYMNELVHPEGKFAGRGYPKFEEENQVLDKVAEAVKIAREKGFLVIYVRFGFTEDYKELPKNSPLFAKAKEFKAVQLGTWATEFHEKLNVQEEDKIITKHRISPFYDTDLETYLKSNEVTEVFLCGVSTDLVVQSTAREAHDRDYKVNVLSDCCVAGNKADNENSLETLKKIATVKDYKELL